MSGRSKTVERIGIISDTHGILRPQVLEELKYCAYILHAGDVTDEPVLDKLRFLCKKIYVVRGNCDSGTWASMLSPRLRFEIDGVRFLMTHDLKGMFEEIPDVDVVISGHTHRYSLSKKGKTTYLNPGSCGFARYANSGVTMAVMLVEDGKIIDIQKIEF
jgi:putative phosphoesterase